MARNIELRGYCPIPFCKSLFLSPIIYIFIEPLYDMPMARNQTRVATNFHWVRVCPSLPRYQRVWFSLVKLLKLQIYTWVHLIPYDICHDMPILYIHIYICTYKYNIYTLYIYTLYIHFKKYIPSSSHESFLYTIKIHFFTICVSPMNHNFCHLNLT